MSERRWTPCQETDAGLWFAGTYENGAEVENADTKLARKLCGECPVADRCLALGMVPLTGSGHANERGQLPWGIWGGLSRRQRNDLDGRRARVPVSSRGGDAYRKRDAENARARRAARTETAS